MNEIRNLNEYFAHTRNIVTKYGSISQDLVTQSYTINKSPLSQTEGRIDTDGITFPDGATLRFFEQIMIVDSVLSRHSYSYRFTRTDGFFFRYEKDPIHFTPDNPAKHPLCHLHANSDEPRYLIHETSFEEIFTFIVGLYYI